LAAWSSRGRLTGKRALILGTVTGLAFTANDRWYVALPIVGALAWVLDSRRGSWVRAPKHAVRVLAGIGAGFFIPILLFEAASVSFLWVAHDQNVALPYETYLQQLYRRYRAVVHTYGSGPRLSQIGSSPYPGYMVSFDGVPWVATAVAASAYLVARWRRAHVVPLLWTFGPLLLASASPLVAPRYMSLAIPGIALTIGFAVARASSEGWRFAKQVAIVAVVVASVSSVWHAPKLFRLRADWGPAIAQAHGGKIISPKSYPLAATAGLDRVVLGFKDTLEWGEDQRAAGARWLLLEVWTPPGTALEEVTQTNSATVLGPLGDLSRDFIENARPVVMQRFGPTDFVYEGVPRFRDRLVLLYDLDDLS
jgi:hypothetical protein